MGGLNRATLFGFIGGDPELRFTAQGRACASFSLATTETWKDRNGERQERTEWHRIVVWGGMAETIAKSVGKGHQVYVEGRLQTEKWKSKSGEDHWTTKIVADSVLFGRRPQTKAEDPGRPMRGGDAAPGEDWGPPPPGDADAPCPNEDDIPF